MTGRYVVLDLETTGLDYKLDRILEIGAVRLIDGVVAEEFHTLVNPEVPMREENVAFHGITPDMVASAPVVSEALAAFLDFLGTDSVVAHNALFDMNFVTHHAREVLGVEVTNAAVDTHELAREVFPRLKAAQDARRAYQRAQFERIQYVAMRYRDVGRLIDLMQGEFKELRKTLEVYFSETGADQIPLPGGDVLRRLHHEAYEFHPEELKAVLAELGILEHVQRIDREKVDRWVKGDRLTESEKAALLQTRRFLGHRLVMSWERRRAGESPRETEG